MILYNLRTINDGFLMAKFDEDFNVEAVYDIRLATDIGTGQIKYSCSCPSAKQPCKHVKALDIMIDRADTGWFLCLEDKSWHEPIDPDYYAPQLEKAREAELKSAVKHIKELPPVPKGVQVVSLEDPEKLHNAIAEAIGEALVKPKPLRRI
jgi:hypothetical protein